MMKNKTLVHVTVMMIIAMVLPFFAMAQVDPGCGPDCPIDGGLSLLIAAGTAYGVKKYREGRKA
jgi:hypothetical protein